MTIHDGDGTMKMQKIFVFTVCSLCLFLPAVSLHAQGDGNLHIYCINVGDNTSCFYKQGDSTLIVSPTGKRMLIDGGAGGVCGSDQVIETLQRVIPTGGMDYMVTSHWDEDHVQGMDDVATANENQYMPPDPPAGGIFDIGDVGSDPPPEYKNTFAGKRSTPSVGQVIDLGGGASATVVCINGNLIGGGYIDPLDISNAMSLGLIIRYGGFDYLTCGDLEGVNDATHRNTEGPLGVALVSAPYNYKVDVLHVSHHGSRFSSLNDYLETIQPQFGVISFGFGNNYGHPTQDAMNHLNALDDNGEVYIPEYPPVTTIYMTEISENGTAPNAKPLQSNPDAGGSIHITVDSTGCFSFANEGPGTNTFNDGPYQSDDGPPCIVRTPTPGPAPLGSWPVLLRVNKTTFSQTDSISINADFYTCQTPFFPYIRFTDPSGNYIYLQRTSNQRTKLSNGVPVRFRTGGPFVLDFTLDYYPVLDASFSNVSPGEWILEGAFLDYYGLFIGGINQKKLTVQ
jgi:beta-lactamase superfamily II metal-dependent hydrolase